MVFLVNLLDQLCASDRAVGSILINQVIREVVSDVENDQFKRSGKKPSEFCKTNLRMHDVKSYDFVKQYFSNPQLLVKAIKEYRRTANIPKGEYSLSDLLR